MRPSPSGTTYARSVGALLAAGCLVGLGAGPAAAHTSLRSTVPAAGATVAEPVQTVRLVFSQPVSPRQAQVLVTAPDGAELAVGAALAAGGTVSQPLSRPTSEGSYLVSYRVLAEDGHPITGQVSFAVAPRAGGQASGAAPAEPPQVPVSGSQQQAARAEPSAGGGLVPALIAGLTVLGAALLLGAVRSARRSRVDP